jgi:two-component system, cell cycle response regulator DivK
VPRRTLLLVTQFADERAIYGDALRRHGFDVRTVADSDEAFRMASADPPDVVVTRVPQRGRASLLARLKQGPATCAVPVVILTTLMQPRDREDAVEAGCDGYLLLPTLPETLISEIGRVFARQLPAQTSN